MMRRSSVFRALVFAAVVGSTASSSPAHADPLSAQDEANARFQTGLKYYDARDFESARLAFTQAYSVLQKPGILLNLALSELYSNRPVEAIAHFEQYLKEAGSPADKRERAKKALDEALKKTGHIVVKAAPDAELRVDDKPIAWPASTVHVAAGSHTLVARRGDKTKTATVDARAGDTTSADLSFDEATPSPPVAAVLPSAGTSSSPPGETSEPPREPPASGTFWGWRSIGGLALVGVGAAGIIVGIVAASDESKANERVNSLGAQLPASDACARGATATCAELASAVRARDDAAGRSQTFLVAGGITAGVGIALAASAIVWPHRRGSSSARLAPLAGPQQAGLLFSSDF